MEQGPAPYFPLYTVGHSNHTLERFAEILRAFEIDVVADVRSKPYARYSMHFHGPALKQSLPALGFKYLFLGKELGGKPENPDYFDEEGNLDYDLVAQSPEFLHGIERLKNGIVRYRVALMCGEENPEHCHRRHLIARQLADQGIIVQHIRGDGTTQTEADFLTCKQPKIKGEDSGQLKLL